METNILLEGGTNELELLEFTVGSNHYGINVAKVREILTYTPVTPVPNAHPFVEGIFMPRDEMITVIDLSKATHYTGETDTAGMLIVTNFNKLHVAFHVYKVFGIHRVSWQSVMKPDATINSNEAGITTGVVKIDGRLIIMLDFEHIVNDISPETGLKVSEVEKFSHGAHNDIPIYIAEDSPLLIKLISDCLKKAGYDNINLSQNGQECWDKIKQLGDKYKENIGNYIKCVITDIEMPMMDGHRLTKLIKSDMWLKDIPVVIFSSLINEQMRAKGQAVGADIQLSKPEIGNLVEEINKLLLK